MLAVVGFLGVFFSKGSFSHGNINIGRKVGYGIEQSHDEFFLF